MIDPKSACFVYLYLFPNGKRYYGIAKDVNERHRKHQQDMRGRPRSLVHKMAIKHGVVETLVPRVVFAGTREECMIQEVELITAHRTNICEHGEDSGGYNVSPGGDDQYHSRRTGDIVKKLIPLLPELADWAEHYRRPRKKRKTTIKS